MAIHKAASSAWDESRIEARPNSHVYWRACKHTHPNTPKHTHTHIYVNKARDKDIEVLYSVGVRVYSRYTYLKLHTASVKLESARARGQSRESSGKAERAYWSLAPANVKFSLGLSSCSRGNYYTVYTYTQHRYWAPYAFIYIYM